MAEESSTQSRYYHHSGKFSQGGALTALLSGLLVGAPMAYVYAWLIHWTTIIYINLLACFFLAGMIGSITEAALVSRKCRSAPVAAGVALVAALGSCYLSWAIWLHFTMQFMTRGRVWEFMNPLKMMGAILAVNQHGIWTYTFATVRHPHPFLLRGGVLWALWALEAAIILGIACYWATHEMLEATFCEACEIWTKVQEGVCEVAAGVSPPVTDKHALASYLQGLKQHAAELKVRLENKDLDYLKQLGPQAVEIAWYQFDLHSCPRCNMTHTLRVIQRRRKVGDIAVSKRTEDKEVLRQLLLSSAEVETLRKLGHHKAAHREPGNRSLMRS